MSSEPNFAFRGIWTPADIILLMRDGKLTAVEAMFLSVVESMTEARGIGCWASNRYLADLLGVTKVRIPFYIRKLVQMRLLTVSSKQGRRVLRTAWANVPSISTPPISETIRGHIGDDMGLLSSKEERINNKTITTSQRLLDERVSEVATFPGRGKVTKASEFDHDMARLLVDIVADIRKRRIVAGASRRWAEDIRLLRAELTEHPEQRIRTAVEWYKAHAKDKGAPRIDCGSDLRKRFNWLEDLAAADKSSIVVSHQSAELAKKLSKRGWPKGAEEQLPIVVEESLRAVEALRHSLKEKIESTKRDRVASGFFQFVGSKIGAPVVFVENWFVSVLKSVRHWKQWSGKLSPVEIASQRFEQYGLGWCREFGVAGKVWMDFVEGL